MPFAVATLEVARVTSFDAKLNDAQTSVSITVKSSVSLTKVECAVR